MVGSRERMRGSSDGVAKRTPEKIEMSQDTPEQHTYEVLFEDRDDGCRYVRRMTRAEADTHAAEYRARIVQWRRI